MIKKPTFCHAVIPLLVMFLLVSLGSVKLRLPLSFLFIVAAIMTGFIAKGVGLTWDDMIEGINRKVAQAFSGLLLLLCIGGLISSWMISGTIPLLIYYGIKIIDPQYLYVTAFLVTAVVATFTGTSFGSAGTIGVAIMGVATAQNLSLPITAGAVVSGAIFGDKMSPCSDTTVLASLSTNTKLYTHIQHMIYTTGGATILSLIVYAAVGFFLPSMSPMASALTLLTDLESLYNLSWILMIPPLIILIGSYLRQPTIPIMLLSSFTALVLGVSYQHFSPQTAINAFVKGFSLSYITPTAPLANTALLGKLLNRGGLMSMMEVLLLVLCVFAFAGIYSKAGFLEVLLARLTKTIHSVGGLIASTIASSLLVCCITGSCYVAILMLGELLGPLYKGMNLQSQNLSRTLEDAGTCAVPIIPWSITAIYLSTALGVPTLEYIPWAVLCYSGMVFAIVFGFADFRITRIKEQARTGYKGEDNDK